MLAVAVIAIGAIAIVSFKSIYSIGFAQLLIGIGDTALAPLLAAMTLGIVAHSVFAERMSRNEAFNNAGNATRLALAAGARLCLRAAIRRRHDRRFRHRHGFSSVRGIHPDAIDDVRRASGRKRTTSRHGARWRECAGSCCSR